MSVVDGDVIERIRTEYLEMPGLRLTAAQAQRLCGLEARTCDAVLRALVTTGFLRRDTDGAFIRANAGA